jgi:uncharacterized protein YbaA (DUF1428 family)
VRPSELARDVRPACRESREAVNILPIGLGFVRNCLFIARRRRMARYVDGYVLPLPKKSIKAYQSMAKKASKVWIDHGALEYRECVGEDFTVKMGVPFPRLAKAKPSETVVFAWIVYKSRAHRDKVNAKVMADPRLAKMIATTKMPFDMKRMSYGGFEVIVSA